MTGAARETHARAGRRQLRAAAVVALVAIAATFAAGCASGPKLPPGTAGVRVRARAEPKAGYQPPVEGGGSGGGYSITPPVGNVAVGPAGRPVRTIYLTLQAPSAADAFSLVDYNNLGDIVVWLEPGSAGSAAPAGGPSGPPAPPPVVVDVAPGGHRGHHGVCAAAIGVPLELANGSATPLGVFLRAEDGRVVDFGTVPANGTRRHTLAAPGAFEVVRDTGDAGGDVLGTVYVAPTPWVARLRTGAVATFAPLAPGRYTAIAWHPRLPGSRRTIDLREGAFADVELVVGVNALPKVP